MPSTNYKVNLEVNAEDHASAKLNSIASGIKVGLVAAVAAAGAAVTAFAAASFKEFVEAEKEMTVANQALSNAAKEHNLSLDNLSRAMDQAGAAALKLGYDDEAASVSFAKLVQATGDAEQAQKDVKLAMDLAAFSGRSLEDATKAIIMVHAGGTRVLKEFGVEVKEGTSALDALAITNVKVGNTSDEAAKKTEGQIRIMNQAFANLKQAVGGVLAEALTPLIQQLAAWATDPDVQNKLKEIIAALGQLITAIAPIIAKIFPVFIELVKFVAFVVSGLWKELMQVVNAIKAVIEWLKPLGTWFDNVVGKINAFIERLTELKNKMAGSLGGAWNAVKGGASNAVGSVGKLFGFQSGGIVNAPLGEAVMAVLHGGERVIPASGASGAPGGGVVVNMLGGTYLSETVALEIGNMIIDRLKLQMRI